MLLSRFQKGRLLLSRGKKAELKGIILGPLDLMKLTLLNFSLHVTYHPFFSFLFFPI
jgi:hypothetical protein